MAETENVIKGLENLSEWLFQQYRVVYDGDAPNYYDAYKTVDDALTLLKEQNNCENCAIAIEDRQPVVRCKDCKYRSLYCTEATDGTTLYTCHHPCANDVPRPFDWFCSDGERRDVDG